MLALWHAPGAATPAAAADPMTRDAGGALIYGTFANSRRVFGLITPTVRINGALPGAATP